MPTNKSSRTIAVPEEGTPEWRKVFDFASKAIEWTERNPEAWNAMKQSILDDCAARRVTSMHKATEVIRNNRYADIDGNPTTFDNNYQQPLARYLVSTNPETCRWLVLHKSKFDAPGMPWEVR